MVARSAGERQGRFQNNVQQYVSRMDNHLKNHKMAKKEALHRIGLAVSNAAKLEIRRLGLIDRGALVNSISYEVGADEVMIGSFGVKYAAIHEFGGVITPKKKTGWLTIPTDNYKGRFASDFDNLSFFLSKRKKNTAFLYDKQNSQIAFILKKQVKIPARPYLRPSFLKQFDAIKDILLRMVLGGQ